MVRMSVVKLAKPLKAVRISNGSEAAGLTSLDGQDKAEHTVSLTELESQKQLYSNVCLALEEVAARLNQLYDEIFAQHNEAIAKLSIEIARKVLMQNISEGDYQIESIIKETLKGAPEGSDMTVRLNPQDLADLRQLQNTGSMALDGIELAEDANIGRGECVIESSKGIVKFLIEDHLEQITKALVKTE